jgi:hypothetical protein
MEKLMINDLRVTRMDIDLTASIENRKATL